MNSTIKLKSESPQDTIKLGEALGKLLHNSQNILLTGNLGSGKTVFVKGIARGLNIKENVNSPSYTLIREYEGRLPLYHMDLYRLDEERDLYDIGFEDYLNDNGIVVIEWPDLAMDFLPPQRIYVDIKVVRENIREIYIKAEGKIREGLISYVNHGN